MLEALHSTLWAITLQQSGLPDVGPSLSDDPAA